MPIKNARAYLEHIVESGENVQVFLRGMTLEGYEQDVKTRSAVERQLMILTEAVIRLRQDAETLLPGIDCFKVRGLGNFIRHEYDNVEAHRIWETIHEELPRLIATARQAIELLPADQGGPL